MDLFLHPVSRLFLATTVYAYYMYTTQNAKLTSTQNTNEKVDIETEEEKF